MCPMNALACLARGEFIFQFRFLKEESCEGFTRSPIALKSLFLLFFFFLWSLCFYSFCRRNFSNLSWCWLGANFEVCFSFHSLIFFLMFSRGGGSAWWDICLRCSDCNVTDFWCFVQIYSVNKLWTAHWMLHRFVLSFKHINTQINNELIIYICLHSLCVYCVYLFYI